MACILVVDGDGDTREALKAVLAGEGFDVRIAADGAEALVHASQPDKAAVVLLDEDLFEEMQGRPDLEGIPVVLMSSDRRRLRQPVAAGLHKPFSIEELLRVAHLYCAGGESGRPLQFRL